MPAPLNKQPIFTATPILVSIGTDIQRNADDTVDTNKCTVIYTDNSSWGSLITKITVQANAGIGYKVSNKRVDLYISTDSDSAVYALYQSKYMVGDGDLQQEDEIPSVVFEFPEGLVVKSGKKLALSATENNANSGEDGDKVSIIVEGGTYDDPTA
jgi:hypothetical protein